MDNIKDKKVLITGGFGFLGKHLKKLIPHAITPTREECDFRRQEMTEWYIGNVRPDIIIHLAASVGGIGYNQDNPATLFYDNIIMGVNLINTAFDLKIEKFVQVGTICAYPKFTPVPFKEENLWNGYPEETNAPYGLAKKSLLVMLQAYRKQYGFNGIYLLSVNLYGEGDNFSNKSSHVIPALIKKFVEAKEVENNLSGFGNSEPVIIWGTGKPTREFLYVGDCADAIYKATLQYNSPEPVNLGSGMEISIRELAHKIADIVGYTGKIEFDLTKPDGQPRRMLDVSKAEKEFKFKANTSFDEGLKKTVDWYLRNKQIINYYENIGNNTDSKRYNLE